MTLILDTWRYHVAFFSSRHFSSRYFLFSQGFGVRIDPKSELPIMQADRNPNSDVVGRDCCWMVNRRTAHKTTEQCIRLHHRQLSPPSPGFLLFIL